jgi:hypothetical protein
MREGSHILGIILIISKRKEKHSFLSEETEFWLYPLALKFTNFHDK